MVAFVALAFKACTFYKAPEDTDPTTFYLVATGFHDGAVGKWVESELWEAVRRAKRPIVDLLPGRAFPDDFRTAYAAAVTALRIHNARA